MKTSTLTLLALICAVTMQACYYRPAPPAENQKPTIDTIHLETRVTVEPAPAPVPPHDRKDHAEPNTTTPTDKEVPPCR